jgi:hypothetical protein
MFLRVKTKSDHNSIIIDLSMESLEHKTTEKVTRWRVNAPEEKWETFRDALGKIEGDCNSILGDRSMTVDEKYSKWVYRIKLVAM